MRKLTLGAVVLGAMLLGACCRNPVAASPIACAQVEGSVLSMADLQPVPGAIIRFQVDGNTACTVTTNKNGAYVAACVPLGTVTERTSAPGFYESAGQSVVTGPMRWTIYLLNK